MSLDSNLHPLASALDGDKRIEEAERLPELAANYLTLRPRVEEMVERYAFMNHCVVVGRGLNYANAYEFAMWPSGFLQLTFYTPLSLSEHGFPAFLFAPPGRNSGGLTEASMRSLPIQLD